MIIAEELRIGNYLYFKNTKDVVMVDLINNKHFDCRDEYGSFIPNGNYEPIPLTEEVLLKCGFVYSEPFPNVRGILFNENFEIGLDGEDFILDQMSVRIDKAIILKVKYLHQLQNIWFVHKGQELTIEL